MTNKLSSPAHSRSRFLAAIMAAVAVLLLAAGGPPAAQAQSDDAAFDHAPKWTGQLHARAYSGAGRAAGDDTTGLVARLGLLASEPEDLYEADAATGAYTSAHASWDGFNSGAGQENAGDDLIMGLFELDNRVYAVSEWGRVHRLDADEDGWNLHGDFGNFNNSNPLTGAFSTPDGRLYITYDRSSGPTIREVNAAHVKDGTVTGQSLLGDHIAFGSGASGVNIAGLAEHGGWVYLVSRGTSRTPPTLYSFKVRNQDGNNEIRNLVQHGPIEGLPTPSGQSYPQAGALEAFNGQLFLGMRNDLSLIHI